MGKINQPDVIAARVTGLLVGDVDPLGEQAVKGLIIANKFRRVQPLDLPQCLGARLGGDVRVEAGNRSFDLILEQHVLIAGTQRR